MAIELNPIANPEKVGGFNTNFQLIEDYINDNLLNRDGQEAGEVNHMEVDLDMNGNTILNANTDLTDGSSLVSLADADFRYVNEAGDTMRGTLDMGGQRLTGLPAPSQANDAARFTDVQNALAGGSANLIGFDPYQNISSTNVQAAIEGVVNDLADPAQGGELVQVTSESGDQLLREALNSRVLKGEVPTEIVNSTFGEDTVANLFLSRAVTLGSVADIASLPTSSLADGTPVHLAAGSKSGLFEWYAGDYSAKVSSDPQQGVYVAPSTDLTGASGAWVRQYAGQIMAEWFGALEWAPGGTQDSTAAFQAASDFAGAQGGAWFFKGIHRITSTVTIPNDQTFGSFGFNGFPYRGLTATPETFDSVESGSYEFTNAVYFDATAGDAFQCGEGASPRDFGIYSRGFNTAGIDIYQDRQASVFYDTRAFAYGKYIKPERIAIEFFKFAFDSREIAPLTGNYYSVYSNCFITNTYAAFKVSNTISYNTKVINCRINVAKFGQFDVEVKNFHVIGGSIEGYNETTFLHGRGNLGFTGTYFETFVTSGVDFVFRLLNNGSQISFKDCLVYLNYTSAFVKDVTGIVDNNITSMGNMFAIGDNTDRASQVYSMPDAAPRGILAGDTTVDTSTTYSITYAPGATAANTLYHAPTVIA